MKDHKLYDITEVCKILETTSRTLRFYEEKGIITSTTTGLSKRRQYTQEQIDPIRNVLVLRTLGLSVKSICQLQQQDSDLKNVILDKRAQIYASIESKRKEIHLLNEALVLLEGEKSIFDYNWKHNLPSNTSACDTIACQCTESIINGKHNFLYTHFSDKLKEYLPMASYEKVHTDTLTPLGNFVTLERTEHDSRLAACPFCYHYYSGIKFQIPFPLITVCLALLMHIQIKEVFLFFFWLCCFFWD